MGGAIIWLSLSLSSSLFLHQPVIQNGVSLRLISDLTWLPALSALNYCLIWPFTSHAADILLSEMDRLWGDRADGGQKGEKNRHVRHTCRYISYTQDLELKPRGSLGSEVRHRNWNIPLKLNLGDLRNNKYQTNTLWKMSVKKSHRPRSIVCAFVVLLWFSYYWFT